MPTKISVIVPYYKGNQYLPRLFASIEAIIPICQEEATEVEPISEEAAEVVEATEGEMAEEITLESEIETTSTDETIE